jgi:ATP/maltotriose-dependent transcriptional regulator MalT
MAMTFFLHESLQPDGPYDIIDRGAGRSSQDEHSSPNEGFPLVREKLAIPDVADLVDRERVNALLRRSREQFPATLISGRAGTGKTAIAAKFATDTRNACWYTVEATDVEWPVFSRYFSAALSTIGFVDPQPVPAVQKPDASQSDIARFLLRHFFRTDADATPNRSVIVLDDIHHIFDVRWFEEFFYLLLYSLPRDTHLIMLCRSKPPAPLMRLRSKQMLNLLDEKVIAFDEKETELLLRKRGRSGVNAERARRDSFGRVSKILQIAG